MLHTLHICDIMSYLYADNMHRCVIRFSYSESRSYLVYVKKLLFLCELVAVVDVGNVVVVLWCFCSCCHWYLACTKTICLAVVSIPICRSKFSLTILLLVDYLPNGVAHCTMYARTYEWNPSTFHSVPPVLARSHADNKTHIVPFRWCVRWTNELMCATVVPFVRVG